MSFNLDAYLARIRLPARPTLDHLGLAVTRLIRLSYGPFQLGHLARGAVEEVPAKVLREQLGRAAPRPPRDADRRR